MITLMLLHPLQSVAVQTWTFGVKPVIRIGRSKKNEVTLYSAVVSRHHVELRLKGSEWELVSLGSNGTFVQGKRINRAQVFNGMIVRLASSGPQIQIWTQAAELDGKSKSEIPGQAVGEKEVQLAGGMTSPDESQQIERAAPTGKMLSTVSKDSKEELERAKETRIS